MSTRHDSPTRTAPAGTDPAVFSRRGMLWRGGLATAAGVGVLSVLDEQHAEAATSGGVGVFSPFDHGAVGDGSNDDTAAIQAALDDAHTAGGGTVLIPGGYSYELSAPLHVYSGTTVVAYGAYLFRKSGIGGTLMNDEGDGGTGYSGYTNHRDIAVLGGTWDGKASATQGFTVNHGRNYLFRDVTVRNIISYHALDVQGVQHMRIENCRFEGYLTGISTFPRGPIQIDTGGETGDENPCDDITVQNCYAGASPVAGESGAWGRLIDCHTAGATPHTQIRILDNVADNVLDTAIRAYSWSRSIIEGNVVSSPGAHGIFAGLKTGVAGSQLIIRNNIITGAGAGGIRVESDDKGTTQWSRVDVDGNQIDSSTTNGVYVAATVVGSITDNDIFNVQTPAAHCIQLGETSAGAADRAESITVKNNRISATVTAPIRLNGARGCLLTGNKVMGTSTSYTSVFSCQDVDRTIITLNDCASTLSGTAGSGQTASTWCVNSSHGTICKLALSTPQGQSVVFDDYTDADPTTCGDNYVDGSSAPITQATVVIGGTVLITPSAANTPTKSTVTFPSGLFTTAPIVIATAETSVPGTQVTGVGIGSPTATEVDIYLTRTNTTNTTISWIATGK